MESILCLAIAACKYGRCLRVCQECGEKRLHIVTVEETSVFRSVERGPVAINGEWLLYFCRNTHDQPSIIARRDIKKRVTWHELDIWI